MIWVTLASGAVIAVPQVALATCVVAGPNAAVHIVAKTGQEVGSRAVSGIATGTSYVGSLLYSALFFWQSSDENVEGEKVLNENEIEESKQNNGGDQ